MNDKQTGGPAFPLYCGPHDEHNTSELTLRDYFAAKAMQAWITTPEADYTDEQYASAAYAMADAMLKERAK